MIQPHRREKGINKSINLSQSHECKKQLKITNPIILQEYIYIEWHYQT